MKVSLVDLLTQQNRRLEKQVASLTEKLDIKQEELVEKDHLLQASYSKRRVLTRKNNVKIQELMREAEMYKNIANNNRIYCIALSKNEGHIPGIIKAVR